MSIHTKTILGATMLANFLVCAMAYIAVDANELPTYAVMLVPYAVFGWVAWAFSYSLDLLFSAKAED